MLYSVFGCDVLPLLHVWAKKKYFKVSKDVKKMYINKMMENNHFYKVRSYKRCVFIRETEL